MLPPPIFCGNVEFDARQSELERLFAKYGKVERIDMKSGFAFIYMEDERDAEYAIRRLDRREFGRHGRRLRVEWSKQEQSGKRSASERRSTANSRPSKTLFVINFDPINTRMRDLERHFEQYGKVLNVRIKKNFAFIQFESQDDATKALEATNMSKLMDRVISVEYAVRDDDANKNDHYLESDRRERSPELARGRGRSPEPDRKRRDRSLEPDRKRRDRSPEPDRTREDRSPKPDKRRRDRSPEPDRRGRDKSPEPDRRGRDKSPQPDRRGRDKSPQPDKKGTDISPERPEPDMKGRDKSVEPDRRENDMSPEPDKIERERSPEPDRRGRERSPELDRRGRDRYPETERRGRDRSPEPDRRGRDRQPETGRRGRERTPEPDRKGRDRSPEKSRDHRQSSGPYRRGEEMASPDPVHPRSPQGKHQEKDSRSPNNYMSESPENKICYSRSPSSPEKEERD